MLRSFPGRRWVLFGALFMFAPGTLGAQPQPTPKVPPPQREEPPQMRAFSLARSGEMNVIDETLYALAEHYLARGKNVEALQLLERVASSSPDAEARSASRYNMGRIYEERLGDALRARTEYARVSGRWGGAARNKVLAPLKRDRNWGEAIAFLKECLAVSTDPEDKSEIARSMLATVRESGETSLIESVAEAIMKALSYEEAHIAAEARRKKVEELRKMLPPQPALSSQSPEQPAGAEPKPQGFVKKGPFGAQSVSPGLAKPKSSKLEEEARELEKAGFEEEAKRLRERAADERF